MSRGGLYLIAAAVCLPISLYLVAGVLSGGACKEIYRVIKHKRLQAAHWYSENYPV